MMKKIFALLFICLSYGLNATSQTTDKKLESVNTLEDKIYGLSLLWSEIKYNFVHIDRLNLDVDSLYRATMSRVVETKNDVEYYKELNRFLVSFNDAHTQLLSIPESGYEMIDYPKYGTQLLGDKFYFTTYLLNNDSDQRLLGAEIIEIEGIPAMEYAEKYVMPHQTASTENYKRASAGYGLLNGLTGTYIKGKALCRNGKVIDFNIIRNGEATRTPNDMYWETKTAKKNRTAQKKTVKCDWIGRIAVVEINRFWPEDISNQIDSVMNDVKSKQPKGVIIDLRKNSGGSSNVAVRLQMHLTALDSIKFFGSETRNNLGYGRAQGNYRKEYEDYFKYVSYEKFPAEIIERDKSIKPLECPVVVLIGTYSFSACEDFLVNIYEMPGRPMLIGEETAGSTGAPLVISLPNDTYARICTLRVLYPYSLKPFTGKGVMPDIEIKPTIDDYLKGTDPVMVKALSVLNND